MSWRHTAVMPRNVLSGYPVEMPVSASHAISSAWGVASVTSVKLQVYFLDSAALSSPMRRASRRRNAAMS